MKKRNSKNIFYISLLLIAIAMMSFGFLGDDRTGTKKAPQPIYKGNTSQEFGKQGDAYVLNINNIQLPINSKGILADVNVPGFGSLGKFLGKGVIFSSGFFLSGFADGQLWANAVASASLVEDYESGTVAGGNADPNAVIYVLSVEDDDFGVSWQDWIDAVGLGADFYDGDGDGLYTPVDKNGNGEWDPDEDRPDLIGDELVWCVYTDGIPTSQRRWDTVPPYGIEIRQSVFAFASAGAIGNLIFLRYRFKYVGFGEPGEAEKMTEVYFGVWADPDVGNADNDIVGSDVSRNAGYTYDNGNDAIWGNQPPCYMVDFFSGPVVYIAGETFIDENGDGEYTDGVDTPIDTAFSVRGQVMGVVEFPGAKNMPVSSFVLYLNGVTNLEDPENKEQARNYMTGLQQFGSPVDPCTFAFGLVQGGVDCTTVDPRFWFSGDPVSGIGWNATLSEDVRQMLNTGPFELIKGEESEIVVAYVIGQGVTPLNSITVARVIDDGAQNIFDLNFLAPKPPPATTPVLTSSDNFIDIAWETDEQVSYLNQSPTWDLRFHQFEVYAFRTNSTADIVSNTLNSMVIARYQVDNFIASVFKENSVTGGLDPLYPESPEENKLDVELYSDPATGRLRLRVFEDPFNPGNLISKGTPYYFAVVGSAINYDALIYRADPTEPVGTEGDYYLATASFVQNVENIRQISSIVAGEQIYDPPVLVQPANQITGASMGDVGYDVIINADLQNAAYEVTFFKDSSSAEYSMFWSMENLTTNTVLVDTSDSYTYGQTDITNPVTEGFITKVEEQVATIDTLLLYEPESDVWYSMPDSASSTGAIYVGTDIPQGQSVLTFGTSSVQSDIITADRLRKVELRFGTGGMAYRYLNGFVGVAVPLRRTSYVYAAGVTTDNPNVNVDLSDIGKLGEGFVDVPFTAWDVDDRYENGEQQLAVGFIERGGTSLGTFPNGNPDGEWDPSDSLLLSGEVIVIFDAPYDPSGGQIEYTGGVFGSEVAWADIIKQSPLAVELPDNAPANDEQRAIFNSPWFNPKYVLGLQKKDSTSFYTDGDVLTILLTEYPYTDNDVYQFSIPGGTATDTDQAELFNKVNVFPNPLYGFNTLTGFTTNPTTAPDDPWVTFTNLPTEITIRIYSLSGQLLRTLDMSDKSSDDSPFLRWDLLNENGLRAASGLYLAIVSSPLYGDKILKFTIIMPQKQLQRF